MASEWAEKEAEKVRPIHAIWCRDFADYNDCNCPVKEVVANFAAALDAAVLRGERIGAGDLQTKAAEILDRHDEIDRQDDNVCGSPVIFRCGIAAAEIRALPLPGDPRPAAVPACNPVRGEGESE